MNIVKLLILAFEKNKNKYQIALPPYGHPCLMFLLIITSSIVINPNTRTLNLYSFLSFKHNINRFSPSNPFLFSVCEPTLNGCIFIVWAAANWKGWGLTSTGCKNWKIFYKIQDPVVMIWWYNGCDPSTCPVGFEVTVVEIQYLYGGETCYSV